MHQQIYPKKLPPSVIKAVWVANVPKDMGGERMSITSKLLPQESRFIFEKIQHIVREFMDISERGLVEENDINELIEKLSDIDRGDWFEDDITTLKNNPDSTLEVLRGLDEFVNEKWFDGLSGKGAEFTKLSPQQALQYIESLKVAK